jgi:hypothetical protein
LKIEFTGPFSWEGAPDAPSIQQAAESHEPGIYIETVSRPDGHLVYYVGETGTTFLQRMKEHYRSRFNAEYRIYAAEEFARGEKVVLWPGIWDPLGYEGLWGSTNRKSKEVCRENAPRLKESALALTRAIRYHFAPLYCDRTLRKRIEAALACEILARTPVPVFYSHGVRYCRRKKEILCIASSQAPILGLPEEFFA